MNVRIVEVAGIKWFTDAKGFIKPVVSLAKEVKTKAVSFDGIAMGLESIHRRKLGKGSRLKVKATPDKIEILDIKVKQPKTVEPLDLNIDTCPTCGSAVEDFHCTNDFCSSKAVAQVYKLFKAVIPDGDLDKFKVYLTHFRTTPAAPEISIGSLMEFLHFVSAHLVHSSGTTGRVDCFPMVDGVSDPLHEKYEIALVNALKTGLRSSQFWSTLNFRDATEAQLEKLSKVDYTLLASNTKAFDQQLHEAFTEDFDSTILVRDILHSERGLIRIVKTLEAIKNGANKEQAG